MDTLLGNGCSNVDVQQTNITLVGVAKTVYSIIFRNPVISSTQLLLLSFSHNVDDTQITILSDVNITGKLSSHIAQN